MASHSLPLVEHFGGDWLLNHVAQWHGMALDQHNLLARGAISDRPFGKTVGTIALRGVSGQLTAESEGAEYAIVFEHGHIVAARSPNVADSARAIALHLDLLQPTQITTIEQWLDAVPDADVFQVIAQVALMSNEEVHRLRRRVIAQRAARMVSLARGEFVLTSTISLDVQPDCEMHVGGVIYQSARMYHSDMRLREIVAALGGRFELRTEYADIPYFGFGEAERTALHALAGGVTLDTLLQLRNETDRQVALAVVYALASCGAVYCEASMSSARFARGTASPVRPSAQVAAERSSASQQLPAEPPPSQNNAEEAYKRAQAALKTDRVDDAIFDLELATQIAPNEPRYFAALAWARFCREPDKTKIAGKTRAMLGRAIARDEKEVQPHFYLGMVERIMNRPAEAMDAFREVLERQPHHQEAATELRFLARKR
jgi:tetratricopeptide (TPR) repeat protein